MRSTSNYFHYDYSAPALDSEVPFSIALAAGPHIAGGPTKLLRIGIQAKLAAKRATNLVFLVDVSGSMALTMDAPRATAARRRVGLFTGPTPDFRPHRV